MMAVMHQSIRHYFMFLMISLFAVAAVEARSNNPLQDEMEDYAKDVLRVCPELAGDKRTREAREALVTEARNNRLLELSEDQAKLLKRRKDVVNKAEFETLLEEFKSLAGEDKEAQFLLKYAEDPRIKPAGRLLAFRMMGAKKQSLVEKRAQQRSKRIHKVANLYKNYVDSKGKAPGSLEELGLPDDCRSFSNPLTQQDMDWIYLGAGGRTFKLGNAKVVIVEPVDVNGTRMCGLENGEVSPVRNADFEKFYAKLQEDMKKPKQAQTPQGQANGKSGGAGGHPAFAQMQPLMRKYVAYRQLHDGEIPASLDDLNLNEEQKMFVDPDSGEKSEWVYLGRDAKLKAGKDVHVVLVAPYSVQGVSAVGLSNGKMATGPTKSIEPVLKP